MIWEWVGRRHTIETTEDRLFVDALLDDELDVRMVAGEREETGEEKSAGVMRGRPSVAALEDEFADVR